MSFDFSELTNGPAPLDAWQCYRKIEKRHRTPGHVIDHLRDRTRQQVEGRDWRRDDRADFSRGCHCTEMAEMERAFAHDKNEASSLLQVNVGSPGKQVVRRASGNGRKRADRAGSDDHAGRVK
jgi:hypothetical protein